MRPLLVAVLLGTLAVPAVPLSVWAQTPARPHNVVLFVADGLRAGMVNEKNTPTMAALMAKGVRFTNPHSLFPTFTTANASGMATGHHLGDSGDFSNTIYTAFPVPAANNSVTPFLEQDQVLGQVDAHFDGNYLNEETVLRMARANGSISTAAIGKIGPVLIFDNTARDGQQTVVIDDATGNNDKEGKALGIPLSEEVTKRFVATQIAPMAPGRGENGKVATLEANVKQQAWFSDVATKVVMPMFKERNKPFLIVYWSRDPDGSQHNQGDSVGRLVPGINGPTSLAAIKNADDNLAKLQAALREQGLEATTDIIVTADHGFSTISKESATSWAATQTYKDVPANQLPSGFVAIDLAHGLGLTLFDPDDKGKELAAGAVPSRGNGLIGDAQTPQVVVAANGGSDLVYIPSGDKALAAKVVSLLASQDYVSGLFVDDSLGKIAGTLPLSAISLKGTAATPTPAIVINFRSFSTGCADPTTCGVEVADTSLQQGMGMHGSFSRADTRNFMAAAGPSFRQRFEDTAPASNADLGMTVAHLLGVKPKAPAKGKLLGRVLNEATPNGAMPTVQKVTVRSEPDALGQRTVVVSQIAGDSTHYFDVAGYPGRTLGLPESMAH